MKIGGGLKWLKIRLMMLFRANDTELSPPASRELFDRLNVTTEFVPMRAPCFTEVQLLSPSSVRTDFLVAAFITRIC